MSLNQSLYFMSLVGGMAGLFCWTLVSLISSVSGSSLSNSGSDALAAMLLGGLIAGLTVGFSDHWSGNRVMPRWIISGTGIGILAGLAAGIIQAPIKSQFSGGAPILARTMTWMVVGMFIGLGLGLRWVTVNKARVAHALLGGLVGGALGGAFFALQIEAVPELSQAMAFVLTGVGISFGVTLAPILMREGALRFVSSGDPRAQSKFGRTRKEWGLQEGDSCVIGSQSQVLSHTRYRPEIEVFIPDATIAPRHARLLAKEGRFYLARHPDIASLGGLARYVLRVGGKTVSTRQELRDTDDILVGRTAFVFVARRKTKDV